MKLTVLTLIAGVFFFLFMAFIPKDDHADDQHRQHMMEMMNDPAMAEMIMEHIAEDGNMRMKMMHKMHAKMHGDGESMMEMCKRMMNKQEHNHLMDCCEREDKSHKQHHL